MSGMRRAFQMFRASARTGRVSSGRNIRRERSHEEQTKLCHAALYERGAACVSTSSCHHSSAGPRTES